jgi:hypothetical protein
MSIRMAGAMAGKAAGSSAASPRDTRRTPTTPTTRSIERRIGLPSARAVVGGLLVAMAAVGTFVASSTDDTDGTVEVVVAQRDLRPGDLVAPGDLALVGVELPQGVGGLFGSLEAAAGRRMVAPVNTGEFLQSSATVEATSGDEHLEVTVSVPASRAPGRLRAGERVDVFSTWNASVTELVAVDARALEVTGSAGLSGGELVRVRLGLGDLEQLEAIVHAHAAGDLTLVRAAIGSGTPEVGRRYRPLSGDIAPSGSGPPEEVRD